MGLGAMLNSIGVLLFIPIPIQSANEGCSGRE